MIAIVFETPTLLDLRALTTFGVSAKPNSTSPIGHFGTGLKYAVAGLVRLGCTLDIYVGHARYVFEPRESDFRGSTIETISMVHDRYAIAPNPEQDLPFTTALGARWEPWQLYRELEANTRDELGRTYEVGSAQEVTGEADHTRIVVSGAPFLEAYENRAETFLPDAVDIPGAAIQIIDRPSRHLYYRGMRAYDLHTDTLFTYNLLGDSVELTEDRTLKYPYWDAQATLACYLAKDASRATIERILRAPPGKWEHGMDFDSYVGNRAPPSEEFKAAATSLGKLPPPVAAYVTRHLPPAPSKPSIFDKYPRPWRRDGDGIVADDGRVLLLPSIPLTREMGYADLIDTVIAAINEKED